MTDRFTPIVEREVQRINSEIGSEAVNVDFKTVFGTNMRIARVWMKDYPTSIPGNVIHKIAKMCDTYWMSFQVRQGQDFIYIEID